jgi:hypothetical protein
MSETVTVIEAKNPNPWEHGITFYDMIFDRNGQRFGCSWGTKGGEPQPGEEVTGEFSQKPDGSWKFSKGTKDKAGGGGSTETRTSNNSKASKDDVDWDAKEARITRQAVLKILSPTINKMATEGRVVCDSTRILVEELEQFVSEAPKRPLGQGTSQGAARTGSSPQPPSPPIAAPDSAPVDFSGARTEEPRPSLNFPKEDLVNRDHVLQLLDSAGLTSAAAREKVADYITGPLLVEGRSDAALSALQDLDRQGNALAQLKTSTEAWIKGPLPTADGFDDGELPPF